MGYWCGCVLLVLLPAAAQTDTQKKADTPAARARELLASGAAESDPETRREVAASLSLISSRDPAVSILTSLAKDKDHLVREAAIISLGDLNDRRLAGSIRPALEDDVPEVVFAAARSLHRLKDPEGTRVLTAVYEREEKARSGFVRSKIRDVARSMKTPKSAAFFVVRQGIGFVPVPGLGEGFSAMSSMIGDADFSPRATALLSLAAGRSPDAALLIEEALNDEDWSVRAAAIQLTALRNERRLSNRLVPMFQDGNKKVKYRAAAAYLRRGYAAQK
jgi:HEAT repeat protein